MTTFIVSTLINQPLGIVTKALVNPENFSYWTTDLVKFEVMKGTPGEVGAINHLHYLQKGRSYVMEDKLIYCEPGKKYVSQVSGDALTAIVETVLHPLGNKTEMKVTWSGKGKLFFLKFLLPLLRGKLIKQSKAELGSFKKLVETKGYDFKNYDHVSNKTSLKLADKIK
ncbi:MAG: hypothetical protein A3F72_13920 [Bacteroidetes bacterium RIFCSPLOWO2_12_FULL_35_15]|nr:MAG: hypothetical protein A3F72_13920 [Bacteroidetes bacterium RIFCSPLOWO2_12_FULL_35_15]